MPTFSKPLLLHLFVIRKSSSSENDKSRKSNFEFICVILKFRLLFTFEITVFSNFSNLLFLNIVRKNTFDIKSNINHWIRNFCRSKMCTWIELGSQLPWGHRMKLYDDILRQFLMKLKSGISRIFKEFSMYGTIKYESGNYNPSLLLN